jgi:prophage regulatory protein
MNSEYLLRLPQVLARVGLSRSTVYQRMADGLFPVPVSLGERAVAWKSSEIDKWIKKRTEAGRVGPGVPGRGGPGRPGKRAGAA